MINFTLGKIINNLLAVIVLLCMVFSNIGAGPTQDNTNHQESYILASTTFPRLSSKALVADEEWQTFSDSNLEFSFNYPNDWYKQDDPTFRKPALIPGVFERRVVFSTFEGPLLREFTPKDSCMLEVFVGDANVATQQTITHGDYALLLHSQPLILRTGLKAYKQSYDLKQVDHYNHRELYIPYDKGILAIVSWSTSMNVTSACNFVFQEMQDSLSLSQTNKSTQLFPTDKMIVSDPMPRVLELPFSVAEKIQQGWKYTYSQDPHLGIDYISGEFDCKPCNNFDVLAPYGGQATYLGYGPELGHTIVIKHEIDGKIYYTRYGHLDKSDILGTEPVVTGAKIGVAGQTGSKAHGIIHLHFEVSAGSYGPDSERFDPYDLYNFRKFYPSWDAYIGLGPHHSWKVEPAVNTGITLYENPNYGGWSLTLTSDDLDLCDNPLDPSQPPVVPCFTAPSWTDNASSIKVAPGWHARLHKHNIADADKWKDDASQGVSCNEDIPDFRTRIFPDGTPLGSVKE